MTDKQTAAFPHVVIVEGQPSWTESGMLLRDYFAGKALIGLLANSSIAKAPHEESAAVAYSIANAMMTEREK